MVSLGSWTSTCRTGGRWPADWCFQSLEAVQVRSCRAREPEQEAFRRTVLRRWFLLIALLLLGYGLYEYVSEPSPSAPRSHRLP